MQRVTVDVNAEALLAAQRILGAPTPEATINRSLAEVVRRHRLVRLSARRFHELDPEVLDAMRRPRRP